MVANAAGTSLTSASRSMTTIETRTSRCSRLLGHANLSTRAEVYAHLERGMKQRAADRMDAILRRPASEAYGGTGWYGGRSVSLGVNTRGQVRAQDFGRGAAIRTRDLLNPIQVRYQAAPRPDRAASLTKVSHAPIWVSLLRARDGHLVPMGHEGAMIPGWEAYLVSAVHRSCHLAKDGETVALGCPSGT